MLYFCISFSQDFVWAFGQVLAGVVTISLPIRYGASKFRNEIVNQVCCLKGEKVCYGILLALQYLKVLLKLPAHNKITCTYGQNALRTTRGRYQMNLRKEKKLKV